MFTSIVTNYKQKKKTHITTFYKLDSTKAIEPQLYTQKKTYSDEKQILIYCL